MLILSTARDRQADPAGPEAIYIQTQRGFDAASNCKVLVVVELYAFWKLNRAIGSVAC